MLSESHPIASLHYIKYGTGPTIWLALHGIGQDASCFAPFGERLAQTQTIYSLNLPFHGPDADGLDAEWPVTITKPYWQRLLADFLSTHQIDRFSVAGFSMGGRFALVTAELFTDRIDQLILLAPDGVTDDPWFRTATSTRAGQAVLRFMLNHTGFFHQVGTGLVRLKLLKPGLLRFAEATLKTPAQRTQIYRSWTAFHPLTIDVPALAQRLRTQQVAVCLILGKFDAVLPAAYTQPLLRALPECRLVVLPTGHTSLVRRAADEIML